MIFGLFIIAVALGISVIAAYYSIIGLTAIFAAAFLPIVIMGAALELGKIVSVIWLHKFWDQATFNIKSYLTVAVALLMFVTSMGIFGFLSKAHVEQTAKSIESAELALRNESKIIRQNSIIKRAEQKIVELESAASVTVTSFQDQIDMETVRIKSAYDRIQPAIDEQNDIITSEANRADHRVKPYEDQLSAITGKIATIDGYIANGNIRQLQALAGTSVDGVYGKNTAAKVTELRESLEEDRVAVLDNIGEFRSENSPLAADARKEIKRLRSIAEGEVRDANALVGRLRDRLGIDTATRDMGELIDEQMTKIRVTSTELERLIEEKYVFESDYRQLEAEVGPIKYIAELVYGEVDRTTLEDAVRWVILLLVIVFDPLALALLIAGIVSIELASKKKLNDPEPIDVITRTVIQYINAQHSKPEYESRSDDMDTVVSETVSESAPESSPSSVSVRGPEPETIIDVELDVTSKSKRVGWLD